MGWLQSLLIMEELSDSQVQHKPSQPHLAIEIQSASFAWDALPNTSKYTKPSRQRSKAHSSGESGGPTAGGANGCVGGEAGEGVRLSGENEEEEEVLAEPSLFDIDLQVPKVRNVTGTFNLMASWVRQIIQ